MGGGRQVADGEGRSNVAVTEPQPAASAERRGANGCARAAGPQSEDNALDLRFMARALELAREAERAGEVPVGAVIVKDGAIVGEGWNRPISTSDPTAHAEIIALRAAAQTLGSYRLLDTTLYVTLEPCAMCAGAMVHSRVKRLVYAATDPRAGAAGSVFNIVNHPALNHRLECEGGLMAEECGSLLRAFFMARR